MKLPKSLSSSFNILTVWAPRGGWVVWLCAVTVRGASRITYCIVQQLAAADPSLSNHFLSIHTLIILLLSPLHPGSASWFYQVGMLTVGLAGGLGIPSLVWPFQRQNVALASAATEHSSVGEVAQPALHGRHYTGSRYSETRSDLKTAEKDGEGVENGPDSALSVGVSSSVASSVSGVGWSARCGRCGHGGEGVVLWSVSVCIVSGGERGCRASESSGASLRSVRRCRCSRMEGRDQV